MNSKELGSPGDIYYYDPFGETWTNQPGLIASVEAKLAESMTMRYRLKRLWTGIRTGMWEPDTRYLLTHLDFVRGL